jgi:hypothetical protein
LAWSKTDAQELGHQHHRHTFTGGGFGRSSFGLGRRRFRRDRLRRGLRGRHRGRTRRQEHGPNQQNAQNSQTNLVHGIPPFGKLNVIDVTGDTQPISNL